MDRARLIELLECLGQPVLEFGVNMARWSDAMKSCFVELGPDDGLMEFLERILGTRASKGKTRLQRLLRLVMSDYDANALLGMYPMHLLSDHQAEHLLSRPRGGRLLDIGAGSGDVTAALKPLFDSTEVVETSAVAVRRLRECGYSCQRYDVAEQGIRGGPYDVIAMLNVLDRTSYPVTLLRQCRAAMERNTKLLLSIPLPYRPYVCQGVGTAEPRERLAVVGNDFSDAMMRLVNNVILPASLVPIRMTRLPYLSGGDSDRAITVLSAAVLVCHGAD